MNELKVFNNNEFGDVRVVEVDSEPCFVCWMYAGFLESLIIRMLKTDFQKRG